MVVASKCLQAASSLGRYSLGKLTPAQIYATAMRQSHAHVFRKRPGQLIVNRIKDVAHFYFVGIGILPVFLCMAYNHIVHGPCELQEYPTEGPPPHYWQFERTPVRQWWAKHFGLSDIEHHERNLAYFTKQAIVQRWRQIEQRVRHLEGERWDYQAWNYQPVSATWVDYGRWHALRLRDQYEQHGHYTF
uniref:NADH dehydrogenase [ubiquinone] 1 beta subcomplex subunit 5, mitochondrial n=1 Tax=Steinernema glaseri TaxID=37863 RepID=A0A1I7Z3Z6_9BILA